MCVPEASSNTLVYIFVDTNGENTVNVQPPLRAEWRNNDTAEPKSAYPKEADIKATTAEAKKKPVMDFKVKGEQRYQKPVAKDDDTTKRIVADPDAPTISSSSSILPSATTPMKPDEAQVSMTTKSLTDDAADAKLFSSPPSEPRVSLRKADASTSSDLANRATMSNNDGTTAAPSKVTKETRGRALNISAAEPINSLNANLTDLSDVSMDEDDKEVEGDCRERGNKCNRSLI